MRRPPDPDASLAELRIRATPSDRLGDVGLYIATGAVVLAASAVSLGGRAAVVLACGALVGVGSIVVRWTRRSIRFTAGAIVYDTGFTRRVVALDEIVAFRAREQRFRGLRTIRRGWAMEPAWGDGGRDVPEVLVTSSGVAAATTWLATNAPGVDLTASVSDG